MKLMPICFKFDKRCCHKSRSKTEAVLTTPVMKSPNNCLSVCELSKFEVDYVNVNVSE